MRKMMQKSAPLLRDGAFRSIAIYMYLFACVFVQFDKKIFVNSISIVLTARYNINYWFCL